MAQQPPPGSYPNYGYMQMPPAPHQNGNQQQQQQNLPNGFPPTSTLPSMKPTQIPTQQLPPQPIINYQNFQTKAIQPGAPVNGSNSALSSRTSSPGVQQQPTIPQSQLPPSRSFPSYQPLHGNQVPPPSSQLPIAPMNNNNTNAVGTNNNVNSFAPHPVNTAPPGAPPGMPPMTQQLSSSMKNLSMNPAAPPVGYSTPPMPSSKSDQNFLNNNNNNAPGIISNPAMPQMPPKPVSSNMAKRPMYPAQSAAQPPMPQQNFPQQQQQPQVQGFNNYPGAQIPPQQPMQQQPQPGNLQYQNFPQQQQQQQPQPQPQAYPPGGGIVGQGFSRMWGNETMDLMQHRHILPPTKVLPPVVKLNHQFHEATNCSTDIFRCTLTKIPESNSLLQKSRLPLGILIHPYRDLSVSCKNNQLDNDEVKSLFFVSELARDQLYNHCTMSCMPNIHQSICILRRQQEVEM